ncbi:sulfhydryl oxidase 1-like [Daphnia pulicaria]|uniref:sulfhydryl oxidase 1-like n=1 Tax=Daphnia pulicaria TaxID=35523 RepID=UPI001EECAFC4|nr:sulfhydryl oxidase 1-like [Daphnia pulicaria]
MRSKFMKLLFLLLGFVLSSINPVADAIPLSNSVLYKDSDPIVQMNIADFKSTIVATSNAWLVEFYSSWCGHCIDFAPAYIQLANDVKGWEKVIKVGAVDCAKEENIPLCRDFEIMGYPTLKFFPAFTDASHLGIARTGGKKVDAIRNSMIDFIEQQFAEKKAPPHWPVLGSLQNETLEDLWNHYNNNEIILLFETIDNSKYWSREAIMDAHQYAPHYPPIRRVNATHKDLVTKYNVQTLPAFVFLERTGKSELYQIQPDRDYMKKIMRKFFDSENEEGSLAIANIPKPVHTQEPHAIHTNVKAAKDQVYMADLEGALLYAFGHEVSVHKLIVGKELAALKQLINVLDQYFPGRPEMKETIHSIRRNLEGYKKQIRGEEFSKLWRDALNGRETNQEWVGCRGSRPNLRGYPCSLWTTFHTLTVNYALKQSDDTSNEPNLILQAMKGFIKYFFGCAHCSNHFVDMAEDEVDPIESVKSPRQAVLWLWAAHNKVNRRIASDASEDSKAPKIQFPAPNNCPDCRPNGVEREEAVYDYLIKLYHPDHISSVGLLIERNAAHSGSSRVQSLPLGTLSFTGYDISLCAAIYLVSSLILMLVLCRILVKRRRYVRKQVYDVCGKLM